MRSDRSGCRDDRYVGGRRPDTPDERARKRLAHLQEMQAHQPNGGGLDWLTTLQRTDPKKVKKLQQTTNDRPSLHTVKE
jgi:hypothetical protein